MAYTVPTYADFIARFPAFASYPEPYVTLVIAEASASVPITWIETDYAAAIMYLTAHLLTTEAGGPGGTAGQSGPIQSESFGPISKSYAVQQSSSGAINGLSTTEYGRRFAVLQKRSFPAVAVV